MFGNNPNTERMHELFPGVPTTDETLSADVVEMRKEVSPRYWDYFGKRICFDALHSPSVDGWYKSLPKLNIVVFHVHLSVVDAIKVRYGLPPTQEKILYAAAQFLEADTAVVIELNPLVTPLTGVAFIARYIRERLK